MSDPLHNVRQQKDALVDQNGNILIRYEDLLSSSPTRAPELFSSDFSDTSDFSQKLKEVTNLNDLNSPKSRRSKKIKKSCITNTQGSLLDHGKTDYSSSDSSVQEIVRSPYFNRGASEERSPKKNSFNSSSQIAWSSSPSFHEHETLASLQRKGRSFATKSVGINATPISATRKRNFHTTSFEGVSQEINGKMPVSQDSNEIKPSVNTPLAPIFLSQEQLRVLEVVVKQGQSVFFTGAAGTGKSILLQRIIADLYKKFPSKRVVGVTASTGLAALNIGGATLHSFTGIGLGKAPVKDLVKRIKRNRRKLTSWKRLQVLVIDEISMVDGELFEKLEEIARIIRRNDKPFGGIQLVICGDFFQLPPISVDRDVRFAFESTSWSRSIPHTILLQQVFRQKDPAFSGMLNEMRRGELSPKTIYTFKKLARKPQLPEGMTPTELYPRRIQVEQSNERMLKTLKDPAEVFHAEDFYSFPEAEQLFNLENLIAVSELALKRGAQVMMIKNIDDTLVNGSTGIVQGFMSESSFQMAERLGKDIGSVLSKKRDNVDQNEIDDVNQTKAVFALPDDEAAIEEDKGSVNWKRKKGRVQTLRETCENLGQKWPVVRFFQADGTTRDVLCQPETWSFENDEGEVIARRSQVPLILAWALSIHKSQGQTLKWVKVDLAQTFEKGQAYVAVSRAVSLSGLQVLGFSPEKVMVHDKVIKFYDDLDSVFDLNKKQKETDQLETSTEPYEAHDIEFEDISEASISLKKRLSKPPEYLEDVEPVSSSMIFNDDISKTFASANIDVGTGNGSPDTLSSGVFARNQGLFDQNAPRKTNETFSHKSTSGSSRHTHASHM